MWFFHSTSSMGWDTQRFMGSGVHHHDQCPADATLNVSLSVGVKTCL